MLLVTGTVGCGGGGCTVSGEVTLDGQPLSNGRIALRPAAKMAGFRPVSAEIDSGSFQFESSQKIVPGSYVVIVKAWRPTGKKLPIEEGASEPEDEYEQYLPLKYNTRSELAVELDGNKYDLTFELQMPNRK
ncbi:MAG: hypothetical protein ACR2NM_15640 [Bythopirellula sp.]